MSDFLRLFKQEIKQWTGFGALGFLFVVFVRCVYFVSAVLRIGAGEAAKTAYEVIGHGSFGHMAVAFAGAYGCEFQTL